MPAVLNEMARAQLALGEYASARYSLEGIREVRVGRGQRRTATRADGVLGPFMQWLTTTHAIWSAAVPSVT